MKTFIITACAVALALTTLAANDQRARVLLQAGEAKEKIEGDLQAAIKLYQEAEREAGANRALVAQALLKRAEAYRSLGDVEAQRIYRRLVQDFTDQKEVHARAIQYLAPESRPGAVVRNVAGIDASGNVSADGRQIALVNWSTGNIAVHDLQTGVSRDVTRRDDYDVYDPAISRDGSSIAYQSFNGCVQRKVFAPDRGVLCVISTQGEPAAIPRTLLARDDIRGVIPMDWSPDGRSIVVTVQREDGSAQVAIVKVADGSLAVLHSVDWRGPTRAFFAPDGRFIAFDIPGGRRNRSAGYQGRGD
jgi:Tol biopolymer transport system component